MFNKKKFYFHQSKLSKTRINIFTSNVLENEGVVVKCSEQATYVIVEDSCDPSSIPVSLWSEGAVVLGSRWLSMCIKRKAVIDHEEYIIRKPVQKRSLPEANCHSTKILSPTPAKDFKLTDEVMIFACSQASSAGESYNEAILKELHKLSKVYKTRGDQWRAHGYEKAISAIQRYPKKITTYEEVAALEGVGAKMATKVIEILSTGRLRKVEQLCETEESKVLDLFSSIWGAGPSTANAWYTKGYRTLDDLRQNENLNKQQLIGIKYYKEFLEKMSRKEVEEIAQKVKDAALVVDQSLSTVLCGSYRRGKTACGDVDVVVIRPDHLNSKEILCSILSHLKDSGFITDDLLNLEKSGNQRKYLGVCKLPGNGQVHRRIDIFVVPQSETACAMMHYTGSALFNRSIRLLAAQRGMHLSEHCLAAGVIRQDMKIQNEGHILPTPTEESIFKHLNLDYRPPEERDH